MLFGQYLCKFWNVSVMFGRYLTQTICIYYYYHFIVICVKQLNCQELSFSLTFEFVILILANDFSCYLYLSLCTKFHGLIEPKKTTNISIQRIKENSQQYSNVLLQKKTIHRNKTQILLKPDRKQNSKYGHIFLEALIGVSVVLIVRQLE